MEDPLKNQESEKSVTNPKQRNRPRRISKPVSILLNLLIAGLIVTGLFVILQPYYLHWQQDRKTAELMKSLKEGNGTIVLSQDDLMVPGEEEEFIDQVESWDEPTESGSESTTAITGITGNGTQPTDTASTTAGTTAGTTAAPGGSTIKPTPKPTPKPVVIKAIGQIIIDKIGLTMPIADRAESTQLRVAIGLLGGSSMPGTPGNTILLGHRMYTYGRHFNRLDEVVAGDTVVIITKDRKLTYRVDRQEVILPAALRPTLSVVTTEKQLILVTCTPVKIASHRLLVYAKQISDTPA